MPAIIIPKPFRKILVVGPIYNIDKLTHIEKIIPEYDWVIFNGGLCCPSDNIQEIKSRIMAINKLISNKQTIYLAGRTDYITLNNIQEESIEKWIVAQPNVAVVNFSSRSVIILDGGIPNTIKSQRDLANNLEISFISKIENKPWHQCYDGGLGYVISNNPVAAVRPRYYKHSMQLGTTTLPDSSLYAQEVDEIGLKKTISI